MNNLKDIRQQYNMTQEQLAEILKIPQSNISRWETGVIKLNDLKLMGIKTMVEGSRNARKCD